MNNDFYNDNEMNEETVVQEPDKKTKGINTNKLLKIVVVIIALAAAIVAILISFLVAANNKQSADETTNPPEETSQNQIVEEITTVPAENYTTGNYTVNIPSNGNLRLRKDASLDSEAILEISHGTLLSITEVRSVDVEDGTVQYWGKTFYLGWDGWVAMQYLTKAYSNNVVTPLEQTTASQEQTTVASEQSTGAQEQTTAASQQTTTASSELTTDVSANPGSPTTAGKYIVDAQPYLNMRDGHSVDSLAIAQIPDKSEITVEDVYYDENSTDSYTKYWGKVTYGGHTGWVAMGYLEK